MTKAEIRKVLYCPHCGNKAPQRLVHTQKYMERTWHVGDGKEVEEPWSTFVVVCETCGHIILYDNMGDQLSENEFYYCDHSYPKSDRLHFYVPESIRNVYAEAVRIKEIAPNAFAVQIRRALEALCEDRKVEGKSLADRLQSLSKKGEIPPTLAELTDVLRLIGNIGAHGIGESVHPTQVYAIDDFFKAIVEYVYVAPGRLKEFKEKMAKFQKENDSDS